MFFQMGQKSVVKVKLLEHLFISFKNFDRVPSQKLCIHFICYRFFNMGDGMLYTACKYMRHVDFLMCFRNSNCFVGSFNTTLSFQRADCHDLTAQLAAQFFQIDSVAVLSNQINHVYTD